MPLLASPRGGAGCVIKKISRSILSDADGVVYHKSFGEPPARPGREREVLKLDESCISNPKSRNLRLDG